MNHEGNLLDAHSQASTALLEDYGLRIERLEQALLEKTTPFTERSSGYRSHRPVASALTMRGLTVKGGSRTRFFGPSSVRVLVNLVSHTLHGLWYSSSQYRSLSFG